MRDGQLYKYSQSDSELPSLQITAAITYLRRPCFGCGHLAADAVCHATERSCSSSSHCSLLHEQPLHFTDATDSRHCTRCAPSTRVDFFYRTMHYSAKRGLAIACRPSVCLWRRWIM